MGVFYTQFCGSLSLDSSAFERMDSTDLLIFVLTSEVENAASKTPNLIPVTTVLLRFFIELQRESTGFGALPA